MRVGLLGGSFDPPHRGHIALATAALRQLKLDRVYFVPARHSPFKDIGQQTPVGTRLALLRAALRASRHPFGVLTWEVKRRGPSYTYTTLARYRRTYPTHQLFLIMGSDSLASFPRWKRAEDITRMATLIVGRRPGTKLAKPPARLRPAIFFLRGRFPNVSSTALRRQAGSRGPTELRLPGKAEEIMKRLHLYLPLTGDN